MKITIIGATGGTGRSLVKQAVDAGHDVTVLVRPRPGLDPPDPRVAVVEGDARDPEAVAAAIEHADAVACVLGLQKPQGTAVSDGTRIICEQMQQAGVERLVAVTAMGLGDSRDDTSAVGKLFVRTFMRKTFEDRIRQEDVIRASALNYTLVRPMRLVDGPRTESYAAGSGVRGGMNSKVSREDVAHLVLRQLQTRPDEPDAVSIVGR